MKIKCPTVKLIFNRRKTATDIVPGSIEVQVTYMSKQWRVNTGLKVTTRQWSDGTIVRHSNARALNEQLSTTYSKINKATFDLWEAGNFSLEALKETLAQIKRDSVKQPPLEWMANIIDRLPFVAGTIKRYHSVYSHIEACNIFSSWDDFTVANLHRWDDWVRNNTGAKEQCSVATYHKVLKALLNRAVQMNMLDDNPYSRFKYSRGQSHLPRYLTERERYAIEMAPLPDQLAKVRDVFVVMMYTGLAYSDVAKLSRDDMVEENGRLFIVDRRTKTGTEYKLTILPNVQAILERYDYALPMISNQKMNQYLKLIAAAAGVNKNVTSHMARHTFATWALSQGVPIAVVSKMLAHTDIKTTQIYAKVLQEDVNRGFDLLESRIK